jgi:alpha/beta superfamily hydrolase
LTGPEPYVLAGNAGSLFALHLAASGAGRAVVVLPPFAEDLIKSRRMLSLAERGGALLLEDLGSHTQFVLRFDLAGMGDNGGEFAAFERSAADIRAAVDALRHAERKVRDVCLWDSAMAAATADFIA